MTAKNPIDFEKSLKELETLVEKISSEELSLEAALQAFEQGTTLARQCQSALKEAEQKVQQLIDYETGEMATFSEDT